MYITCWTRKTLEELRIQARSPKVYGCCTRIVSGLYWGLIGGFKYGDKAVKAAEAAVRSTEEVLRLCYRNGRIDFQGALLVTYGIPFWHQNK